MRFKDLKPDDYYYAEYSTRLGFAIIKGTTGRRSNIFIDLSSNKQVFWLYNQCAANQNIRLATPEEIHWLDKCIESRSFVSYEEAMLSYNLINYINEPDPELDNILIKLLTIK